MAEGHIARPKTEGQEKKEKPRIPWTNDPTAIAIFDTLLARGDSSLTEIATVLNHLHYRTQTKNTMTTKTLENWIRTYVGAKQTNEKVRAHLATLSPELPASGNPDEMIAKAFAALYPTKEGEDMMAVRSAALENSLTDKERAWTSRPTGIATMQLLLKRNTKPVEIVRTMNGLGYRTHTGQPLTLQTFNTWIANNFGRKEDSLEKRDAYLAELVQEIPEKDVKRAETEIEEYVTKARMKEGAQKAEMPGALAKLLLNPENAITALSFLPILGEDARYLRSSHMRTFARPPKGEEVEEGMELTRMIDTTVILLDEGGESDVRSGKQAVTTRLLTGLEGMAKNLKATDHPPQGVPVESLLRVQFQGPVIKRLSGTGRPDRGMGVLFDKYFLRPKQETA